MAVNRSRSFPYTVTVDGQPVRLLLKRLSPTEYAEFVSMLSAFGQHRGAPPKYSETVEPEEKKDGEEQSEPIELTLDDVKAHTEYLKANVDWQTQVFRDYVTVIEGDLIEDGRPITDGGEFFLLCRDELSVSDILSKIYIENSLSEEQKKRLQSRSGSDTGSSIESQPEPIGLKPATAAGNAEPVNSAADAGAMARFNESSSGMTAQSSSASVPCAI